MELREADLHRLVRWWTMCRESAEDLLAEDFVYVSPVERHGKRDFVQGLNVQEPQRDVRILAVFVGSTQAAAFFESVDPTTKLAHRVAWLLDHDGSGVRKVTAVHSILPSESST